MKKLFIIALKDMKLIFRDPTALIMMLLAPFLITLGMGLITGRFSANTNSGISNIPVAIVNQDEGELGKALEAVFSSDELADLLEPTFAAAPADMPSAHRHDRLARRFLVCAPRRETAAESQHLL